MSLGRWRSYVPLMSSCRYVMKLAWTTNNAPGLCYLRCLDLRQKISCALITIYHNGNWELFTTNWLCAPSKVKFVCQPLTSCASADFSRSGTCTFYQIPVLIVNSTTWIFQVEKLLSLLYFMKNMRLMNPEWTSFIRQYLRVVVRYRLTVHFKAVTLSQ